MNDFHYALTQANMLYDIELVPEDFEEIGLMAWNLIGNKIFKLYKYSTTIDFNNLTATLPCNCEYVEAVTYTFEDWQNVSNLTVNGDVTTSFTENYIEGRKAYNNKFYTHGKFAQYELIDNVLYFDRNYGNIKVLYKGVVVDDNGLPKLSNKEAMAIATYCAYVLKFKEGLKTNNGNIIKVAQLLEDKWRKLCDAARVGESISQNDMDQILDAKTSWNRKIFNKSYKPVH